MAWPKQDQREYSGSLLTVENVNLRFITKDSLFESRREYVQASNNVSFEVFEGETFGLVGESGSGKSTIARVIAGLYEPNSGKVTFEGIDLTALKSEKERRPLRRQMQMVFQNPYTSMNPRMKISDIIAEPIRFHNLTKNEMETRQIVNDLLEHVALEKWLVLNIRMSFLVARDKGSRLRERWQLAHAYLSVMNQLLLWMFRYRPKFSTY